MAAALIEKSRLLRVESSCTATKLYKKTLLRVDLLGGTNFLDKLCSRLRAKVGEHTPAGAGG